MTSALDHIIVKGAREHNLKNIDVEIPKNKFVVFTGVSGSGKTSLAMDTIYAEGQRRYVESLSAYARQFLGVLGKPDVDSIDGLSPAIAIDQKTTSKNPRSTVGTITEVYDFLRLLYARIGHPHCPQCGREISRQSTEQILTSVFRLVSQDAGYNSEKGVRILILSPVVKDRKGEYSSLFANLKKQGVTKARIDGKVRDLNEDFQLIKTNKHTIDAILSRQIISHKKIKDAQEKKQLESTIYQTLESALRLSNGNVIVAVVKDKNFDFSTNPTQLEDHLFSENFACPVCNISLPDNEPRNFSFNSPHGACPACDGLGTQLNIDENLIIKPNLTLAEGGIVPWSRLFDSQSWMTMLLEAVSKEYAFSLNVPIKELPKKIYTLLLYGPEQKNKRFTVHYKTREGNSGTFNAKYEGVIPNLVRRHKETKSDYVRNEIEKYMVKDPCPVCLGSRLKEEALSVVINEKNIWEVSDFSIIAFWEWATNLPGLLTDREKVISEPIMKEINYRIKFLLDVGLGYLTLGRASAQLSGGESQRIRLASQIGSGLSGVLYVLDEPSIGLHQRDQGKLIKTLKHLRGLGNTVIVVEHDMETMLESDYLFDFGPGAGEHGGQVIAHGTPENIKKDKNSVTGKYLAGKKVVGDGVVLNGKEELYLDVESPGKIAEKITGKSLTLVGAKGRNLKNITVEFPLGKFICVTGVSGSGKSTLVMDTLYSALRQDFGLKTDQRPEPYTGVTGIDYLDKVIAIDQTPIGRTPKSNPATYTKAFDGIRELFAKTQEARIRGYRQGRFSFNVKGGRCEACQGQGQIKIEMQFMPDVYVNCEVCEGKRYNREALEIEYKGKNISEVLDLTIEEALAFFDNIPQVRRKIQTLYDVGLGYIRLGQPATTLSGGEAQRVKLALELSKVARGSSLYILDEPTTGLHFEDLERLINIIKRLQAKGHTILVIEHNIDIIKNADWIIDLGPEGGDEGGKLVFSGPLETLLQNKESYTAQALRQLVPSM